VNVSIRPVIFRCYRWRLIDRSQFPTRNPVTCDAIFENEREIDEGKFKSESHPVKRRNWLTVFFLMFGFTLSIAGAAQPAKIRVLLITGGHAYDREPYLRIYADNPQISLVHLEHADGTADAWDRADLSACDVVVLYDMPRTITDMQKARFLQLFARGTGLVVTHHALVSYQGWPEYERIIGGRWIEKPEKGGDPKAKPSGYRHDVDIPVTVVARNHPVTAGVQDFSIHDEIYWGYRVGADVSPLLTTTHPDSGNPLGWSRTEGRSRVVYLLLGHGPSAFEDPNYRRLLANAIRWASGATDVARSGGSGVIESAQGRDR
jgi:uncharacterized protein